MSLGHSQGYLQSRLPAEALGKDPPPGLSQLPEATCPPGLQTLFLELPRFLASAITSLTASPGSNLPLTVSLGLTLGTQPEKPGSSEPSCAHVPGSVPGSGGRGGGFLRGPDIQPTTGSPSLLFFLSLSPASLPSIERDTHLTSGPGGFKEARGRV